MEPYQKQSQRILSLYSTDLEKRGGERSKEQVVNDVEIIQKSEDEDITFIDDLKKSIDTKFELNKAFDNLTSGDMLQKAISRQGLTPKKVTVTMKNGQTHQAIRWVHEGTDDSPSVKHAYKNVEEGVEGATPEDKINHIVNSDMSPDLKARNLVHQGVYDKDTIEKLTGTTPQKAYDTGYNAGVKHKEFRDDHKKLLEGESEILPKDPKSVPVPVNMAVHEAREALGNKDFEKFKDVKKKELAAKFGITMDNRWDAYDFKLRETLQIGYPKSLIAYGSGGVGKTFTLEKVLEDLNLRAYDDDPELGGMEPEEFDYIKVSGATSKTDMWRIFCENKNKIIIFDDCDSMWGDQDTENFLKSALDTTGTGQIRYGNGDKVKDSNGDPCPRSVRFTGRAVFISNLTARDLPQPLIDSRSSSIDLTMSMDETLDKLDSIKYKIDIKDGEGNIIDASKEDRENAVSFLREFKGYIGTEQVNGRILGQLIGISSALRRMGKFSKDAFYKNALISLRIV